MSVPKPTLIALGLAAALGLAYWGWVHELKPRREAAKERAKLLFPGLGAEQTDEILLRAGTKEILLKKEGAQWSIHSPIKAPVDEEALQRLVKELAAAKDEETVVEKGADLREFGLDAPSGAVTFKPSSPGAKAQALFFGADNPMGTHSYAMVDGKPAVFLVSPGLKRSLLLDTDALREKRLWRFEPDLVESFKGPGYALRHGKDGAWLVAQGGREEPGKEGQIHAWLSELSKIKADKIPSEDGRGPYGLAGGRRYEVVLKDGAKAFLVAGAQTMDKGLYVQAGGEGPVYQLSEFQAQPLNKRVKDLMDLAAFKFDPFSVERYTVEGAAGTLKAAKKNGAWEWELPSDGPKDFDHMAFCTGLIRAELTQRLPAGQQPKGPLRTVTFYDDAGTVLEKAVLGARRGAGQEAFSQQLNRGSVVPDGLLDGLPKAR